MVDGNRGSIRQSVVAEPASGDSLLAAYAADGGFTDGYRIDVAGDVDLERFVAAFYTTPLFRLERFVLSLIGKPSTDAQVAALARGEADAFAAWTVEGRRADELLMCDFQGRTRSWFKVEPAPDGGMRLRFGSAIVPERGVDGRKRMGGAFRALLGFHRLYSIALLRAAAKRLG
jgi:hypothetical protein